MKVYDTANLLADEIRDSEEYKKYKITREIISLKPDVKVKIDEFEKARYEVQLEMMQTGKQNEEKTKEIQGMYAKLIEDEDVVNYFDAELKFNVLLADVNKIIGDTVKDIVKF